MINVLINERDELLLLGIKYLFLDIFQKEYSGFDFTSDHSAENIQHADIIIQPFCWCEDGSYLPEIEWQTHGVIIGLLDKLPSGNTVFPICQQDIIFVHRGASQEVLCGAILCAWKNYCARLAHQSNVDSANYRHRILSPGQARVMARLNKGEHINKVSHERMMVGSTTDAHKYTAMKKIDLCCDSALTLRR